MVSASSLLPPSAMKGLASCVGAGAIRIADVAVCTTPASTIATAASSSSSSSMLSVTSSYRSTLLSSPRHPPLLLRLTWSITPLGPALSFSASDSSPAVLLRKRKGSHSVAVNDDPSAPLLGIFWDLTSARYSPSASPEPASGYYVVAVANSEVVLAAGDLAAEFLKAKFEGEVPKPRFAPLSRWERVVAGAAAHATRVRFAEGGPEHEVSVGCAARTVAGGEELWLSVDGERAVQARRLRWNLRGNQTVFIDGAPVDFMWDLHGWWFREPPGCAVFMLRARSALESRLWLEEENAAPGFALVVQAFKSPR